MPETLLMDSRLSQRGEGAPALGMGGCFHHQVSPHLDTPGYLEPWNISEFIRLAVWCYQLFDRKKRLAIPYIPLCCRQFRRIYYLLGREEVGKAIVLPLHTNHLIKESVSSVCNPDIVYAEFSFKTRAELGVEPPARWPGAWEESCPRAPLAMWAGPGPLGDDSHFSVVAMAPVPRVLPVHRVLFQSPFRPHY